MLAINYYNFLTKLELWAKFARYLTYVINYTLAQNINCMCLRLGRPGMRAVHVKRNLKNKSRHKSWPNPQEFRWHKALWPNSVVPLGWSSWHGALGATSWWRKMILQPELWCFHSCVTRSLFKLFVFSSKYWGHNISFSALLSWVKENLEQYLTHSRCSTNFSSSLPYHADLENSPAWPLQG